MLYKIVISVKKIQKKKKWGKPSQFFTFLISSKVYKVEKKYTYIKNATYPKIWTFHFCFVAIKSSMLKAKFIIKI